MRSVAETSVGNPAGGTAFAERAAKAAARCGSPTAYHGALFRSHVVDDTWFRGGDWANQWLSL